MQLQRLRPNEKQFVPKPGKYQAFGAYQSDSKRLQHLREAGFTKTGASAILIAAGN